MKKLVALALVILSLAAFAGTVSAKALGDVVMDDPTTQIAQ